MKNKFDSLSICRNSDNPQTQYHAIGSEGFKVIIRIVIILLLLPLLFGCAFINEFDVAMPRNEDLWTKPNYSKKMVIEALNDCRNKIDWLKSTSEIYNENQKCMLQAGFIFNDITAGARPLCNKDLFVNTPGCQSMKQRKYEK